MSAIGQAEAPALLAAENGQLLGLIGQLRRLIAEGAAAADRSAVVGRIGGRLRALATVERELVYPAAGSDATDNHDALLALSGRLAAGDGNVEPLLAALERQLGQHEVDERQRLLPLLAGQDLAELGAAMTRRRAELLIDEAAD